MVQAPVSRNSSSRLCSWRLSDLARALGNGARALCLMLGLPWEWLGFLSCYMSLPSWQVEELPPHLFVKATGLLHRSLICDSFVFARGCGVSTAFDSFSSCSEGNGS